MRAVWGSSPLSFFDLFQITVTLLAIIIAFTRPALANKSFARVELFLRSLSQRPLTCALILFLFPLLLRLLLLPGYPAPEPFISDEYAYLLQADTFASGRLTNPSPALWQNFTSVYILAHPTFTAEYQVAQGLTLAVGQLLTGVPWVGVMLTMAVMCAVIYWALLGWLPPVWAFSGTLLVVDISIGVLSYWMNTYWGGCVPAIGGALTLGGLVRLRKQPRILFSLLTAAGIIILFNSRPLESLLLTVVAVLAVLYWTALSKEIPIQLLLRRMVPPLVLSAAAALAFAGYYNYRVTGSATEFPYLLYRSEFAVPQGFFWQKDVVAKTQLPADIDSEYEEQLHQHQRRTPLTALLAATFGKLRRFWYFYIGIPLTVPLLFLPSIWREPNMRLAAAALFIVLILDNLTFFAFFPHYAAPVAVLIFLALIQCLRKMRAAGPAGLFLSRALPLICTLALLIPITGRFLEPLLPSSFSGVTKLWNSEFEHDISREQYVPLLARQPGKQLVLVRYQPFNGERKYEWIFNFANLHEDKIVWARDPGDANTVRKLIAAFPGRKVWLAEPDAKPPRIVPYPPVP